MAREEAQGRSGRNGYAALELDRQGERRGDVEWLAAQLADPATRFCPVWRSRNLVVGDPPRAGALPPKALESALTADAATVFLGSRSGAAVFAVELSAAEPPADLAPGERFVDLRNVASLLPAADAALLAFARGIIAWHRSARFCGACGAATVSGHGGFVRHCTAPGCGRDQFPRTDPAIIVLVQQEEKCLLARQPWWEPGRHSVIAGFVEPGETFEAAVAREVLEETGVEVTEVRYRSSQPWPFPSSIMVGFQARAGNVLLAPRDGELESIQWLSRQELAHTLQSGALTLPPAVSIAYRLIEEWFDAAPGWRLGEWTEEG